MTECHPHCQDTWPYATIIRYLIADNGTFGSIHDEPDIGFDTTDLDVCFVGSKYLSGFVIVVVYEGLYADRSGFAVVGYLLMGDSDAVDIFECLCCFTK